MTTTSPSRSLGPQSDPVTGPAFTPPLRRPVAGPKTHAADASRRLIVGLSLAATLLMVGAMARHARAGDASSAAAVPAPVPTTPSVGTGAPTLVEPAAPSLLTAPAAVPTTAPPVAQSHAS